MKDIYVWIAELIPLLATLAACFYGVKHFFKKGKPLFLQSLTMAMASHALGSVYYLCRALTDRTFVEGFTPAYLGRIGFFLFILTASYGQLDRIVDDGTAKMRFARRISLLAPLGASLLYLPGAWLTEVSRATKISCAFVWLPAIISVYFNMKHATLPDVDLGLIKALRPYNVFVLLLSFSELLYLTAWNGMYGIPLILASVVFSGLCIGAMVAARKGVEQWAA